MMRTTLTAAALSLLVSSVLSAQTPAPAPAPQTAPPPFQKLQVPTTVTTGTSVTGCLKALDAGAATAPPALPPAGERATAPAPVQYVLTNVVATPNPTATTVPGAGAPPSAGPGAKDGAGTYQLQSSLFIDLAIHANQQVKVTGAMASDVDPWFGAPAKTPPGAAAPAPAPAPSAPKPPTFIVSSITMIAKTCS